MTKIAGKPSMRLTNEQRVRICMSLACYMKPPQVRDLLKAEFGIDVKLHTIARYDPKTTSTTSKRMGKLAEEWVNLFDETRAKFIKNIEESIPEAHKAVRVRMLAEAARTFQGQNRYHDMADALERIAKEMGNVHTNKREITGKGEGPIDYRDTSTMSEADAVAELRALLTPPVVPASAKPH